MMHDVAHRQFNAVFIFKLTIQICYQIWICSAPLGLSHLPQPSHPVCCTVYSQVRLGGHVVTPAPPATPDAMPEVPLPADVILLIHPQF